MRSLPLLCLLATAVIGSSCLSNGGDPAGPARVGRVDRAGFDEEIAAGDRGFAAFSAEVRILRAGPDAERIRRVGNRLIASLPPEARRSARRFDWQFYAVDDQQLNANGFPNGTVTLNAGMIRFCQDDAQLAAVVGHEMVHIIKQHYRANQERGNFDGWSLSQEKEADVDGFAYLAHAGYDPRRALAFWDRYVTDGPTVSGDEVRTHPSHEVRRDLIQSNMPYLLGIYQRR